MDFAHRLVSLAYQSLEYFVVEGVPAGLQEADLLAIKISEFGSIIDRVHVEVQVSVNPIGVLRAQGALKDSANNVEQSAGEYISKKYESSKLRAVTSSRLRSNDYRRVFVHGRLKDRSQLEVFRSRGIECIPIGELVSKALAAEPVSELKRQLMIADLLSIRDA